ncbi:MAG: LysR family transcriptional regulator [Betaproteobacteria bacterium]|nr:LysR family transcriptional regulator [Betaproteobacteria bacterium]
MDRFKELQSFVLAASRGSLSAAARAEGVSAAVISRRLDALEQRLGVRLLVRTTRRVSLTYEGAAFLEDAQRILDELANAEAAVSLGGIKASGHIRLTAPAGFGRLYIAPLVQAFLEDHSEVSVDLDLGDRVVDIVNEGFDCAIRFGELSDSSLVSIKLGQNRRLVVASPAYLEKHGTPASLDDLARHNCLTLGQQRGWLFANPADLAATLSVKVAGRFVCNDGAVLHEWALAGLGLAWRSFWEVGEDLRAGRLAPVLEHLAAPPIGVYAVFPQRRQLALRVRLLIDSFKHAFAAHPLDRGR